MWIKFFLLGFVFGCFLVDDNIVEVIVCINYICYDWWLLVCFFCFGCFRRGIFVFFVNIDLVVGVFVMEWIFFFLEVEFVVF